MRQRPRTVRSTWVKMMPNHHAVAVANEIWEIAKLKGFSVSPMQLQKLLYFCYGWNIEIRGEKLISDGFEAWQYGPVHPAVYREFRRYGSAAITSPAMNDFASVPWRATLSDAERNLVDEVVSIYGGLSGPQMSHLTHREGTPWHHVWAGGFGKNDKIPDERIREEFQELRKRAAA